MTQEQRPRAWKARSPRRLTRRRLLRSTVFLAAGAVLVACGGDDLIPVDGPAESGPPEQSGPDLAPLPTVDPGQIGPAEGAPATLEVEPLIWIVPKDVPQGNSFLAAVDGPGAGFASVAFDGQVVSMLREGTRFFAILGIDALTPVGPTPVVISVADAAGRAVVQRESLINVVSSDWQTEVVELDESNQGLLDPDIIAEDRSIRGPALRVETPERHWDGVFDPPSQGVITSNYGLLRSYNFQPPTEYHSGLDFAGDNGDPVVAPNAGVVAWVGQTRRRGNGLIVDHGGGIFGGFYHMSEVVAREGDVIEAGDFIGRIGATGLATGPHLHWEIVVHGVTVNPVQWIRIAEIPDPLQEFDPLSAVQSPNLIADDER